MGETQGSHHLSTSPDMSTQDKQELPNIIAEMNALNAVLRALDQPQELPNALRLVRTVWTTFPTPQTVDAWVIGVAMATLLGEPPKKCLDPITLPPPIAEPWTMHIFEHTAFAWGAWTQGDARVAQYWIRSIRADVPDKEGPVDEARPGAVHRLALEEWANAVMALTQGQTSEAKRFFKRASEVGQSFGTESHPVILWTMAASLAAPQGRSATPTPSSTQERNGVR